MNGGVKAALLVSVLSLGGCASSARQVEVRAIPDRSAILSRGGDAVAVARGQFALGNVGLALEGFRKAQRENPADPAALAGIGDCYSAMGRFDIAQSNYEAALALAPNDRRLLLGLAAIFEHEGQMSHAAQARADADRALRAAQQPIAVAPVAAVPARAAPTRSAIAAAAAAPAAGIAPVAAQAAAQQPDEAALAVRGSITVELPPARPADHVAASAEAQPLPDFVDDAPLSSTVTVALPPARPAPPRSEKRAPLPVVAQASAPRLERLSSGEVALVTTAKPLWRTPGEIRTASAEGLHWVALASTGPKPNVQVVNAAQRQGIAASARSILLDRGWRRIAIATAPATRQESVVLYPRNRERLGRSLANQFGVKARMVERDVVVLVLGRDAVGRIGGQRKS